MVKVKEFTDYVNSFTKTLSMNPDEKNELQEEMEQHLGELMDHFIKRGHSKEEAVKRAIEQFGSPEQLLPELKKSHSPSWKQLVSKEMLIWLICLLAASLAPILLINAHYTILFAIFPLIFLIGCTLLYHGIIRKVRYPIAWIGMFLLLYGSFTWDMIQYHSLKVFIEQLVTFRLSGEGVATLSILHLLWLSVFLRVLHRGWRSLARTSYEYWAMIAIAVYLVRAEILTNSGEGNVLLLNTFVLYVFLQQMIESEIVVKLRNKMKFWIG